MEKELQELTGTALADSSALDPGALSAIDSMHYRGHETVPKMLGAIKHGTGEGGSAASSTSSNMSLACRCYSRTSLGASSLGACFASSCCICARG